ncbi:REP-associated tyrosine transposase [Planctomycetes bacterium Pan216]
MPARQSLIDDRPYARFVTFSCDKRRKLLSLDRPKRIVIGELSRQLERHEGTCVGFVVMPNHVHVLLWFEHAERLPKFMHEWKRLSSHSIRSWYKQGDVRYHDIAPAGERFWMPKYHVFNVYEDAKLLEKLAYMHANPVRANLVDHPLDWPWSSARWYELGKEVGVPISSIGGK